MLYDASARAVIAVAWGQKGECMRSIILSWVLLLGLGCSSDAVDTVGNQSGQGPNGGKADNLDNTDGGVIETDGEVIATDTGFDGGAPDTGEDLSDSEPVEVDPFASAWDVNAHRIEFPEGTEAPRYRAASGVSTFGLGGTEFWQKWPEGHNPTYSYNEGTVFGQRCMYASARRFEAIMADPPATLVELKETSNWSGRFFNWNDDFSQSTWSDGRSARLWAWRTSLVKWISQTNLDGSCFLPTYEMVETLAANCLAQSERRDGEIQGCRAP